MKKEYMYQIARYGKCFFIVFFAFLCSTAIFQILRSQMMHHYVLRYSYQMLFIFSVISCCLFLCFYFLEKHYKSKLYYQKAMQLLHNLYHEEMIAEDAEESGEESLFDCSWGIKGLEICIHVAQKNLQMFYDQKQKEMLKEEAIDLFVFEKLIDRLLEDVKEYSLLGIDIRLIMNHLENILEAYKNHVYDAYIEQLDIEEQLHIQLLLCDESFALIKETMHDRFNYLPPTFMNDLKNTFIILNKEIENGNPYAQYDLANIYLSSNYYKGMEFAIDLLYKAQDSHKGAKEYIERLRNA